jgi:D-beta-D-heptose 7-phosphate kinase/D-beta-D-heptose 1-phosphate adenosyltransferase
VYGKMGNISPEAPVPRVIIYQREYAPGAAGNVAKGMSLIGAKTFVAGVIGKDKNGGILRSQLEMEKVNTEGLMALKGRNTPTYTRILSGSNRYPYQHLLRMDVENEEQINSSNISQLKDYILNLVPKVDIIFVADYDEFGNIGLINSAFLKEIIQKAREHKKLIGGSSRKKLTLFRGFSVVIPNDIEAETFLGKKLVYGGEIIEDARKIRQLLETERVILTLGSNGMIGVEEKTYHPAPAYAKKVIDTAGAGDTVSCLVSLTLACGGSCAEAVELASRAAAIVVSQKGTTAVTMDELRKNILELNSLSKESISLKRTSKIKAQEDISAIIKDLKGQDKKIVFLNGFFDPPHIGHIHLINKAKELGDILILGLNSDKSVRENKGPDRPFMSQEERANILSSLDSVDYITYYDELTPIKIIQKFKPDILIKGNNYQIHEIVGRGILESYGGKVVILETYKGISSESLANAIQKEKSSIK